MTEENPIIEEIRRTREQLLAKHNGELNSLVTELQNLSVASFQKPVGCCFAQARASAGIGEEGRLTLRIFGCPGSQR